MIFRTEAKAFGSSSTNFSFCTDIEVVLFIFFLNGHPGTKEYPAPVLWQAIHHRDLIQPLAEEAYATVDFPKLLFAIDVLGILGPVSQGSRFTYCLGNLWSLYFP